MNMADREEGGGGSGWLGFLAGIIVVALIDLAVYAYNGAHQQRTAQLDVNIPSVRINPPDVQLPPAPSPTTPPRAASAQQPAQTAQPAQPAPPAQTP
jgi:hypothetical protein